MLRPYRTTSFLLVLLMLLTMLPGGTLISSLAPAVAEAASSSGFSAIWASSESEYTNAIAWGDVDGDGDLDLAAGNQEQSSRLYRNDNGTLTTTAVWSSVEQGFATSVAWGDVDGDGDLDLAVGNTAQPNRIYRNDNGVLTSSATWASAWVGSTKALAWGDVDGDGDLDLVAGNYGNNWLYRNDNGTLGTAPAWVSPESAATLSVAWGDVNGDGRLDLAVGNLNTPNQLYINSFGSLFLSSTWNPPAESTSSVAWGDIDGDYDLDLAVGNFEEPNRIYQNTGGELSLLWSTPENSFTEDVAFGDVDNDGDLDLAVGNNLFQSEQVYLNYGGVFILTWVSSEQDNTTGIAFGDLDNDGDVDLALSNSSGQPKRLYRNDHYTLFSDGWDSVVPSSTQSVAWGDVDADGNLDLAVGKGIFNIFTGNSGLPNQLYRNNNGVLASVWSSSESDVTTSIAWGDIDGDGDLDLAVGNYSQPNRVYLNTNGALAASAAWSSAESDNTASVAWGDIDGDGDLDLAVGNYSQPNRVYLNTNGALAASAAWSSAESDNTASVAWGDIDGDGDLDLAVGNGRFDLHVYSSDSGYGQPNRIYRNDNGTLTSAAAWSTQESDVTSSLAWGDMDGDSDLDLAVGNYGQPIRLYRNDKGLLSATWAAPNVDDTQSLVWGDVDGDGDLDLAVGNLGYDRLYRNDPGGFIQAWSSLNYDFTESVAWGDMDGDGDLDLALGNSQNGTNIIQRNRRSNPGNDPFVLPPSITPPSIRVGQPIISPLLSAANGLANPRILEARALTIPYTLYHAYNVPAGRVRIQFSLNGGGSWQNAVPAEITDPTRLQSSPSGRTYNYVWDTVASGVFGQADQAVVRMIVDKVDPETEPPSFGQAVFPHGLEGQGVPGPFLYGAVSATSDDFRLRGTLARALDPDGQPMANALVYRLPAGQVRGATPLTNRLSGLPLFSDAGGYVNSRDPLQPGDRLAALQQVDDTPKYTVYNTSPINIGSGLPGFVVGSAGTQTLTIAPTRTLIAFKLTISLEWDARDDESFMINLRRDLTRTSELLYDWSDGQAVLGAITIYHDKQGWADADIQIHASNRLRPNATQGGIVTASRADPNISTITYDPGSVRMPAIWNRNGDPGGSFGEDWPRTLAHELGHFALFLDDNYLGLDAGGNLTPVTSCPGAMADPYVDLQSEFHPSAGWLPGCAQTLSNRVTGRSDWETITRFYPQLSPPASFNQNPGPSRFALALLQLDEPAVAGPIEARTLNLGLVVQGASATASYQPSAAARAVLYQGGGQRASDLGTPTGDLLVVRGARNGDTVCVYDTRQDLTGCIVVDDFADSLTLRATGSWRPELRLTPETSQTVRLEVPADGVGAPAPSVLQAQFFPEDGQALTLNLSLAGSSYQGLASFPAPALGALVRVFDPAAPNSREAVADFSLGGEPAPRQRSKAKSKRRAPALSADGQAILFTDNLSFVPGQFYAFQSVDRLPPAPAAPVWALPVGLGYRLRASDATLRSQIGNAALALSYFAADVPPGAEGGIQVYYLPDGGTAWQALPTTVSEEENTASARAVGEGLYVLMASVPLSLDDGWNLITIYPGATQPLPTALAGAAGRYTLVYGYDDSDETDPWKLYAPNLPAPWDGVVNDLPQLENGQSYWLRATQAGRVPLRPALAQSDGILNPPPATYYGLAPANTSGPLSVEALVGEDEVSCGSTTTRTISYNGQTRQGFSLNVLANGGGDAAGCGAPGIPVRFVIRSGTSEVGSYRALWDNSQLNALGLIALYLPLVIQQPRDLPNLQVVSVSVSAAPLDSGEDYQIAVTIRNAGSAPTSGPFWVDLYLDPEQAPLAGEGWPEVAPFGAAWRVYELAAGETLTLSSLEPNDPRDPGRNYTLLPAFLEGDSYTAYVQVDAYSASGGAQGALLEANESDNIGGPYQLVLGPGLNGVAQ